MKEQWRNYLGFGIAAFLVYLAIHYWDAFAKIVSIIGKAATPLLIGAAMAYILNILMSFYEKHYFPKSKKPAVRKSARPVCMISAFLTLIVVLILVAQLVVPELAACIKLLFAGVPDAMDAFADWIAKIEVVPEDIVAALQGVDWQATLTKIINVLSSGIGSTVSLAVEAVSSAVSVVMNLLIGAIFAIYLLSGKERLTAQRNRLVKNYVRPAIAEKIHHILTVANDCFHKYIVGQCTEAVILGTLCAVGMLIFGFPYAVMTGVVIGVTALIPVAGAYIGGAVGFLLILSTESPMKALLFVVYLIILQQLEGNLIYPRVVGASIGLPGIWVLAVVTVGGGVFGIPGMLLGVPLAATVYQLLRNDMNHRERQANPIA